MKLKLMNFILGVVAFTFVLTGCSSNAINDSLNLSENDKTQLNSRGSIEDSIVALTVDTTTTIYKSMQASRSNKMRKAASYEMGNQSALDVLFDLRGLPVNIVVKENTNGSRFLTAMRKKKTFLWNTSYTSLPACFAQKQNDGNTSSQTFYLNYIPLVGDYYLTTKFGNSTQVMSIGSYSKDPNSKFLFARDGSFQSSDELTINSSDSEGSSYYIQNSFWFGSDDPNNPTPWNVWNYTLGCKNTDTYFDKYRSLGTQQFTITPLDNFTITKIEYNNDQTASLEKAPDFVVNWSANNATSVSQQMSTNFGSTASKTSNFSQTKSVSLSVSGSVKVGIPFIADGKISTTVNTSTSATWGESETTQDTRNYNFQLIVPARRRVVASATVSRYHMKLGYTAYLTGVSTGRTIKVKGVWDGVDCTDIVTNFTEYDLLTNAYIKTTTINGLRNEVIKL